MDGRPTWTDCDEAGDYVVPNVLSPRDLVSRPDIMDETVPHIPMVRRPSVVVQNAQTSFLKPLAGSKPYFMWSLLGKGERKFVRGIWVT